MYLCCIFVVSLLYLKRGPMRPFIFVSLLCLCCVFVVSLLCLPLHFSGSQVIEYHWVTEQNFVSRRAVNTKYKYHISWNLAVPSTVTLILRTYPRPINVKGSDKHRPPGQAGTVRCRGLPPQLRFAPLPRPSLLLDGNGLEGTRFLVLDSWIQLPSLHVPASMFCVA